MGSQELAASLEDLCLSAWPAPRQLHHRGWVLRFGGGHSGRANAVTAITASPPVDPAFIAWCETEYRRHGLAPQFRLTPLCPPDMAEKLAAAGYSMREESLVLVAELPSAQAPDASVRLQSFADDAWLAAYRSMVPVPEAEMPALRAILGAIAVPATYATLWSDGKPVAACLGVVDRGWLGLYKVATHPQARGQGHGARLLRAILSVAATAGAKRAYLQVGSGNVPALSLYHRFGFTTAYDYAYARRD